MRRPAQKSVFLARASYRQRRLRDAIGMLPVAGVVLVLMPLLWPTGAGDAAVADAAGTTRNSFAMQYIFWAWAILILASFLLSRGVDQAPPPEDDAPQPPSPGGPG